MAKALLVLISSALFLLTAIVNSPTNFYNEESNDWRQENEALECVEGDLVQLVQYNAGETMTARVLTFNSQGVRLSSIQETTAESLIYLVATPPIVDLRPHFLILSSDMRRILLVNSEGQLTYETTGESLAHYRTLTSYQFRLEGAMDNAILCSNEWVGAVGGAYTRYHVKLVKSVETCGGDKEREDEQ